jgi:hypothetical protein
MTSPGQPFHFRRSLLAIIAATSPLLLSFAVAFFFRSTEWENEPLHSSIEASGAIVALVLGFLLLSAQNYASEKRRHYIWIANSMIL